MGIQDKKVSELIGKESFDWIRECVDDYTIKGTHMKDIARLLGSKINGNHHGRCESASCDSAEMRQILCDWYNEEAYDMDRATALQKLIDVFENETVNLPCVAKHLQGHRSGNTSGNTSSSDLVVKPVDIQPRSLSPIPG